MHITLWIFQALLAIHTAMGAVWKFSNSEQAALGLTTLPHAVWLALSVVEILCALGLIAPVLKKSLGKFAPMAATVIAVEMIVFCAINFFSGTPLYGPMVYWLVVALVSGFVAYGRFVVRPF
jgi:hypothetical protein